MSQAIAMLTGVRVSAAFHTVNLTTAGLYGTTSIETLERLQVTFVGQRYEDSSNT